MARIAYVNGRYCALSHAFVHVEDRGYQFADGVYEVIAVHRGALIDEAPHLDRLARSLAETRIEWPVSRRVLRLLIRQVIQRNGICDRGAVYLQVTRGVAPRNHAFPAGVPASLVITARPLPPLDLETVRRGVKVITSRDERWKRADIKSVSLLPNVLGKQRAVEGGAFEAWLIADDGAITEGTASNAWIVTAGGILKTHRADRAILNGITRQAVLAIAAEEGVPFETGSFSLDDARTAREAFLTSTTSLVKPVIAIDGVPVGQGTMGPLTGRLLDFYVRRMDAEAEAWAEGRGALGPPA